MFDIGLPGVDGLPGLAAHVVDVGAELPGPTQIDRRAHRQLLQSSPLLCQADGLRIFLSRRHENDQRWQHLLLIIQPTDAALSAVSYLSEAGHGLAGDDLIAAEAGDEAQGLVLVLPSFQLAQDQRSEYLHILQDIRDERWQAEWINRRLADVTEALHEREAIITVYTRRLVQIRNKYSFRFSAWCSTFSRHSK